MLPTWSFCSSSPETLKPFWFYNILGPFQKQGLLCHHWLKSKCEQTLAARLCEPRTLSRFWSALVFGRTS